VPFVTWQLQRCSRSLCSSQGSRPETCTRLAGRVRPVRAPSGASWRGARGPQRGRSLKAQQCVRPGSSRSRRSAPPCGGGTERAGSSPTE